MDEVMWEEGAQFAPLTGLHSAAADQSCAGSSTAAAGRAAAYSSSPLPLSLAPPPPRGVPSFCRPGGGVTGGFGAAVLLW